WRVTAELAITSPASGASLTAPPTAVAGTLSGGGTVQVALNGTSVGEAVASAGGAWQVNLTGTTGLLVLGGNAISATAYGPDHQPIATATLHFTYAPKANLAGTVYANGLLPAPGVSLVLLDGAGHSVGSATTGADGGYEMRDLPVGSFTLQAGSVSTQVTLIAGQTTRQDLRIAGTLKLSISVTPDAIVGDGRSVATVSLTVTTGDGKPAAGVNIQLAATAGSLGSGSLTTDSQGRATTTLTAPLLTSIAAQDGQVAATVQDAQGLAAETAAVVRFVPATLTGRLVNGRTGKPLAGARVWVAEDFNGDGVIDFAAETTTAADGSYTLNVPRSNWTYQVHTSSTVQVNGADVTIDSVQAGSVGQVTTVGESFTADRQITGQFLTPRTGQTGPQPLDQLFSHGESLTASLQQVGSHESQPVTISPQGGFTVGGLEPGHYRVVLQVTAPDGQRLAGATMNIKVEQSGEMAIETALVDPYGTVTDAVTGKPLDGVKLTLMWADTPLNRSLGRTPDTPVALPTLPDFAPNQNADPQVSKAGGQYAWMVFPQGDYYILATREGYQPYDSRREGRNVAGDDSYVQGGIIHVGESLVSYSFQLTPTGGGGNHHTRYIYGYPDGTFGPERSITRAEVATVLAQLLGATPGIESLPLLTDVSPDHWAAGAIAKVAARGLMIGDPDGRFRPDEPITRAEVAVIACRLRQLTPGTATFPDAAEHWAAGYIAAAEAAGILTGYPDGTFQPERPTTRAEFVAIINRAEGRGPLYGVKAPTFPDVPLDAWASGMVEEAATDHTSSNSGAGEILVP
ncbi:MAG: S-layer homology domain-containing protein, partial [Mycobacterium leprae]